MLLFALAGAQGADAATEVGSHCEANTILIPGIEGTAFSLANASPGSLPTSSPINGVTTSWKVWSGSTDKFQQRLKVLRTAPGTNTVEAVAEAGPESVSKGSGPFPIRIPVLAGDRFGLNSPEGGVLVCSADSESLIGTTVGNPQPGESETYFSSKGSQVALSVVVEPDLDGDGFGDETQEPCPALITRQVRADKGRNHRLIVGLSGGPIRTVKPDVAATFRLPLGRTVKRRLNRLKPAQYLRARMTARVTDLAGRVTERPLRLRAFQGVARAG